MATIADRDILDLVTTTLHNYGPPRFQQIAQDLVTYEMMGTWMKKDKVVFDHGSGIKRTLMMKTNQSAKHVGRFEQDNVNIGDVLNSMEVPWRHAQTFWAWERQDVLMNRGKALVANIIEPRRSAAMLDLIEELEEKAWAAPSSSSDKIDPYGLPYWIVKNASAGFTGAAASGHTTVANVNLSTYPKFKNYSGTYSAVGKGSGELIKLLRTAARKTAFKSPNEIAKPDFRRSVAERYRCYCNETTLSAIEDVGEAQNENLGRDIASMDGLITFHGNPIIYVPKLDEDTDYPFYMVDHSSFYPVVLAGDYLRESDPAVVPNYHNSMVVFIDFTYNFVCVDRRRNTVLYSA